MKESHYRVIVSENLIALTLEVNTALDLGWVTCGGLSTYVFTTYPIGMGVINGPSTERDNIRFAQALVRRES